MQLNKFARRQNIKKNWLEFSLEVICTDPNAPHVRDSSPMEVQLPACRAVVLTFDSPW